jgi:hypothetical protein
MSEFYVYDDDFAESNLTWEEFEQKGFKNIIINSEVKSFTKTFTQREKHTITESLFNKYIKNNINLDTLQVGIDIINKSTSNDTYKVKSCFITK